MMQTAPEVPLPDAIAFVAAHDLRWADDPTLPYPPGEAGWCPPGWMPLLEALVPRLVALGWNRELHEVKQKLGGLRFHAGDASPAVEAAIEEAEERSFTACEVCGAQGRLRRGRRLQTRCDRHVR